MSDWILLIAGALGLGGVAFLGRVALWLNKRAAAAELEMHRLRVLIILHNDDCYSACDGREGAETERCAEYVNRGGLCPDCPRHRMIDMSGDAAGGE